MSMNKKSHLNNLLSSKRDNMRNYIIMTVLIPLLFLLYKNLEVLYSSQGHLS